MSAHDPEALAAYALGALDSEDRGAIEAHIRDCAECAAAIRSLRRVTGALALAAPARTPPPHLRARVLHAVGADARQPGSARSVAQGRAPWSVNWLPMAAMLLLAVGAGIYALRLQTRIAGLDGRLADAVSQTRAAERATTDARRVADQAQSAMAVLAAPDLARIDLAGQPRAPGASARALWSRQRGMVFTASNLPALPSGRTYQVWVVLPGGPISAGLIEPDVSGRALGVFRTPPDIPSPVAVAVTIEPAGGMPAPTGERVLVGAP